jgi:hypothetical protein
VTINYGVDDAHPDAIVFDLSGIQDNHVLLVLDNSSIDFAGKNLKQAGINFDNIQSMDLAIGESFEIFSGSVNNLSDSTVTYTSGLEGETYSVTMSGSGNVMLELTHTSATEHNSYKPYFEGVAATVLAVSEAAVGVDETITNLASTISSGMTQVQLGFHAASITNKTGSEVDVDYWGLSLALGRKIELGVGKMTFGIFFEAGYGNYGTQNSSLYFDQIHGDGKTKHFGGGLFLLSEFNQGTWLSLAARIGSVRNEYRLPQFMENGLSYTTTNQYFGINFGVGQKITVNESTAFNLYGKLFWTRVEGSDVYDLQRGQAIFDETNSIRTRIGARIEHDFSENISAYFGLAWEHDFSGAASGRYISPAGDTFIADAPKLRGSSGFGEIGLRIQANEHIAVELNVFGRAGQSKGGGGAANLIVTF